MSAPRKKFRDHSLRWQREARRDGLDPKRWDAWLRLSPASRRVSDPRQYAQGIAVAAQQRAGLEKAALRAMLAAFPHGRVATMKLGVQAMTPRQLRWTTTAAPVAMAKRAAMKHADSTVRNPWWYR